MGACLERHWIAQGTGTNAHAHDQFHGHLQGDFWRRAAVCSKSIVLHLSGSAYCPRYRAVAVYYSSVRTAEVSVINIELYEVI